MRLGDFPSGIGDEEDVAQSVFGSICRGAAAGRFAELKSRDDLWWLLLSITKQKTANHIRPQLRQKRGSGRVYNESMAPPTGYGNRLFVLDDLAGSAPTPDFIISLDEQFHGLLDLLDDECLRKIAILRVEGYTVAEIAGMLKISRRTVERKLQLIRTAWAKELS
jgi:DNA-directed RNA polymerase specialized sigma24 family protein